MNNREYVKFFDEEVSSSFINKMFWIAASFNSQDLKELLSDISDKGWEQCLPDVFKSKYFSEYIDDGDFLELLADFGKFGFIAEIHHPVHYNFIFDKNGNFQSCSSNDGVYRTSYVYAETVEELVEKIKINSERIFQDFIAEDKKRKASKTTTV